MSVSWCFFAVPRALPWSSRSAAAPRQARPKRPQPGAELGKGGIPMRLITLTAIAVLVAANAGAQTAFKRIDLDAPGALATLERTRPDHFAKIQQILAEVPRRPPGDRSVAKWMNAEFRATNVQYADFLMTSHPPKKRLEFSLDD